MYYVLLVLFFVIVSCLICCIMLQQEMGSGMHSISMFDNPSMLFNLNTANNLITKITVVLAMFFFIFSLLLGNMINKFDQSNASIKSEEKLSNYNNN